MKDKMRKLYQMCGRLNLYCSLCKVKRERVIKDLTSIENLLKELLEDAKRGQK